MQESSKKQSTKAKDEVVIKAHCLEANSYIASYCVYGYGFLYIRKTFLEHIP